MTIRRISITFVALLFATIHVGAPTPIEKEEKIALMTDAMNSVKSALKHGILPGGGVRQKG